MKIPSKINTEVAKVFDSYPVPHRRHLLELRGIILETAAGIAELDCLQETLRWGEPSYIAKTGSTIRLALSKKYPERFGIYCSCQTKLIDTFRALYRDIFFFEGDRGILFSPDEQLPIVEIKHCITIALTYHKRKHLPLLGG